MSSNNHLSVEKARRMRRQTGVLALLAALLAANLVRGQFARTAREAASAQKTAVAQRVAAEQQWSHLSDAAYEAAKRGDAGGVETAQREIEKLGPRYANIPNRMDIFNQAAQSGHWPVMRLWFDRGWPVNQYALDHALASSVYYGHADIVKILLSKGAAVNTGKQNNVAPLQFAAMRPNAEIARMLLEAGADVNVRGKNNAPRSFGYWNQSLLDKAETYGWTPLMCAARYGNMEVARLLLARHADVTLQSAQGETALSLARQFGHADVARLLVQAGAR